jgi:vancomycin permeability regulator SanA
MNLQKIIKKIILLFLLGVISVITINVYVLSFSYNNIHQDTTKLPAKPVGIIF